MLSLSSHINHYEHRILNFHYAGDKQHGMCVVIRLPRRRLLSGHSHHPGLEPVIWLPLQPTRVRHEATHSLSTLAIRQNYHNAAALQQ